MMRLRHCLRIARQPAAVFAFVTDVDLLPRWQASVRDAVRLDVGPFRAGSRVRERRSAFGHDVEVTWQVVRYEPTTGAAIEVVDGPVEARASYHLRPRPGGSELVVEAELEPVGFARPLSRLLASAARTELATDCTTLRRLIERDAIGPTHPQRPAADRHRGDVEAAVARRSR